MHHQLNSPSHDGRWSNSLLRDLVFIKSHLRYPFSRRTVPGSAIIAILLFVFMRSMLMFFTVTHLKSKWFIMILLPITLIIIFVGSIYQYYWTLRFIVIPTPFSLAENIELLQRFLTSQQLAVYRHPQAPEVYQILSRPLGNPKHDHREVMIFIADDQRILLNSHFIGQRYTIMPASRNSGSMADRLRQWITIHCSPSGAELQRWT